MTPTQLKALEAAKEALIGHGAECKDVNDALALIDSALAEQPAQQEPICKLFGTLPVYDRAAQQEPVAIIASLMPAERHTLLEEGHSLHDSLYASPPAQRTWVGLTDEERGQVINANFGTGLWAMAKDIEAKLREKNT